MPKFAVGARVRKIKGSAWQGRVCGTYSSSLTTEGYAVESEREPGSVQIYPASALDFVEADSLSPASDGWTAWEGGECPVTKSSILSRSTIKTLRIPPFLALLPAAYPCRTRQDKT